MKIDLVVRGDCVITPAGERNAAILIADGKIADVVDYDAAPTHVPMKDYDCAILPGLVDSHVHCNEPGRTEWEGFETATKAALMGGVTTLVDMPLNCSPVTTSAQAFAAKLSAAEGKLNCDLGFWGGVVPGMADSLEDLIAAGVLGFKAFLCPSGIDEFPNATEAELAIAMPQIAAAGLPLLVHCELVSPALEPSGDPRRYATWLRSRPAQFERDAIELLIDLCRRTGCRTHIVHLADADSLPMIRTARAEGIPITVETCPHYLRFAAEEIPDRATEFKCAPPIREARHLEGLWEGLVDGTIDLIASDHSPSPPELKCSEDGDFLKAWGGIASLQLGLSVIWHEAHKRGANLCDVARWMSLNPARLAGLRYKGAIAPGYDADLIVFHDYATWQPASKELWHRHKLTPYLGQSLRGVVDDVYLRGQMVVEGDCRSFCRPPSGRTILRSP